MTWLRWALGVSLSAGLVLVGSPGCADRACVMVSADATSCPNRTEALVMMTPQCGATVVSVDTEGERVDDLCCYDVTQRSQDGPEPPCAVPRPAGPTSGVTTVAASSVSSSSSSSSGTGGVGGTSGSTCDNDGQACTPACDAPEVSPSAGECVAVGGAVACNPVTNEGCDGSVGEACDVTAEGFGCYPAPNIEDLCQPCGGNGASYCKAGHTCFGACFRYCCKDSDCGTGMCFKEPFPSSLVTSVGVCITAGAGGGGSGSGGAAGVGGTGGS